MIVRLHPDSNSFCLGRHDASLFLYLQYPIFQKRDNLTALHPKNKNFPGKKPDFHIENPIFYSFFGQVRLLVASLNIRRLLSGVGHPAGLLNPFPGIGRPQGAYCHPCTSVSFEMSAQLGTHRGPFPCSLGCKTFLYNVVFQPCQ
jgi:hypothetical protein